MGEEVAFDNCPGDPDEDHDTSKENWYGISGSCNTIYVTLIS